MIYHTRNTDSTGSSNIQSSKIYDPHYRTKLGVGTNVLPTHVTTLTLLQLVTLITLTTITLCYGDEGITANEVHNDEVIVDSMGDIIAPGEGAYDHSDDVVHNHATDSNTDRVLTSADLQCRIWLAPSTLQGAGLGMFAGTDFQPDEEFLVGGDITIAITDIQEHNSAPGQGPYGTFLWDEYTWTSVGLKMDTIGYQQNIASEGFGSAANSFLPVYNVDEWAPRITYTNELHRSRDPGPGAYTQYHQRLSTSRRFIEAGEELYVSYGDSWFENRPYLGPIPLYEDLNIASSVLDRYTTLQDRLQSKLVENNFGAIVAKDIWSTFVQNSVYNDSRVLIGAFHHSDPNELQLLQTKFNNNVTAARIDESKRNLDWLRTHGTCGDHIVAQPSTIKQAAMGAFATRFLPDRTIVAQLPMIHVTNRSRFNTYGLAKNKEGRYVPINGTVLGKQLLLNYCYGHAESTLLLCPYGPMNAYVNHNQTLANVRLRWGRSESGNHMPSLLQSNLLNLESDATAKLAMELIAIRDIADGEEIFLDYGDEWEAAWQNHIATWKPIEYAELYRSSAQLQADRVTRLRTVFEEIEHQTYPGNLNIKCDSAISSYPDETMAHYYNGTLERFLWKTDLERVPCTILRYRLDERTGDYLYAVRVHTYRYEDDGVTYTLASSTLVEDVPRLAIYFNDIPFTADQYLPNAFRHDIRIPNNIFPVAWRNAPRQ